MTKNPFLNAVWAALYIGLIVGVLTTFVDSKEENMAGFQTLIPIVMLSLFTLSASVMGYLFLYEPGKLYFDGKREEAVAFFLKTVGTFALITAVLVASLITLMHTA
jgi:hypothetical protein